MPSNPSRQPTPQPTPQPMRRKSAAPAAPKNQNPSRKTLHSFLSKSVGAGDPAKPKALSPSLPFQTRRVRRLSRLLQNHLLLPTTRLVPIPWPKPTKPQTTRLPLLQKHRQNADVAVPAKIQAPNLPNIQAPPSNAVPGDLAKSKISSRLFSKMHPKNAAPVAPEKSISFNVNEKNPCKALGPDKPSPFVPCRLNSKPSKHGAIKMKLSAYVFAKPSKAAQNVPTIAIIAK